MISDAAILFVSLEYSEVILHTYRLQHVFLQDVALNKVAPAAFMQGDSKNPSLVNGC